MKNLKLLSRIIIGVVFIFSGTVKAIDPLGSAYKFSDYFRAFHLDFLQGMALPLGILLCTAEFLAGLSVLTGYRQKAGIWLVMILMAVFTPLTLILALLNPVSDCGCFGDAIHLTNWQTFGKNIILLVFAIIVFSGRKNNVPVRSPWQEWGLITIAGMLFILFSVMNLRYLPVIDFLPYRKGANIPEEMKIPEGKPADQYNTTFIYEKNGTKKEFNIHDYPAGDSSWVFVEQRSVLVRKGYEPPVHDFSLLSINGEDLTEKILGNTGYTLLMVSKKLDQTSPRKLAEGMNLGLRCLSNGIGFYAVTSSGSDEIQKSDNRDLFCQADETTLKTMLRANPGFMLLKGGTIVGKWSLAGLPPENILIDGILNNHAGKLNGKRFPLYIATGLLSAALLLLLADSLTHRKRRKV
jgi:hypothetical protein